jgi:hypothetical protein
MNIIRTEIEIDAPADTVWRVLTDFASYPAWNSFITSAEGQPAVGEKLRIFVKPAGAIGLWFLPKIVVATPNKELRWIGHFLLRVCFNGDHTFQIEERTTGKVLLVHLERFGGALFPIFARYLNRLALAGFLTMNQALKERAEQAATPITA